MFFFKHILVSSFVLWWVARVASAQEKQPDLRKLSLSDIVINEIHRDNADEWIEIYNRGSNVIDLVGWMVQTQRKLFTITPTDTSALNINPGQYFVLSRKPGTVPTDYIVGEAFSIRNKLEDFVLIKDPSGTLIDGVYVGPDWPFVGKGTSLSLKATGLDSSIPANWCESPSGGTPMAPNDCPAE